MNIVPIVSTIAVLGVLFLGPANAVSAAEDPDGGERLFQDYGCGNCHGIDGMNPVSRYVPVLRGKSAERLLEKASAILSGEKTEEYARLMHNQYCIPGDEGANCPTARDLQLIASWLDTGDSLPKKKQTPQQKYISANDAYKMVSKNADEILFLDVRTRAEVAFVGMPTVADAHIPYMLMGDWDEWDERKKTYKLQANSGFVPQVEDALKQKGLEKDNTIIVMCRSGSRSAKAANVLHVSGYENVYTVVDGFEGDKAKSGPFKGQRVVNGWKNAGLPWSYQLDKEKIYSEL